MIRRFVRIFSVVGLVVVVGMAVLGQFRVVGLTAPKNEIFMVPSGVWIEHNAAMGWDAYHYRGMLEWKLSDLLKAPRYGPVLNGAGIFLPWWLLLAGWALVLLLVWKRTRPDLAKRGFPVQSTG